MINSSEEEIHLRRNIKRIGMLGLYDRARGELFSNWLGTGKKVLELGCRDGSLTKLFSRGNEISGADIDKTSLTFFEKNIGGKIYCLNLNCEWPFRDGQFDAVVASEVLEHLYRPKDVIEKVAQSLNAAGLFIGSVPNAFSLINRVRLFMARPERTALADPTHVHQFSRRELKFILKKHFSKVEIKALGRFSFLDKIFPGFFSFILVFHCQK